MLCVDKVTVVLIFSSSAFLIVHGANTLIIKDLNEKNRLLLPTDKYTPIGDPCQPNPCRNGGTCAKNANSKGHTCTCQESWKGPTCEEKNPCKPNPCKNGGTCAEDENTKGFSCICQEPWKGATCGETDGDKNVCEEKNPCKNGGTCHLLSEKDYKCNCTTGFIGKNCEISEWCKKVCGDVPCQRNEELGSYFCSCDEGRYFDVRKRSCTVLDKCLFQRINGNCSNAHETCNKQGECICEKNYAYNDDQSACEPDYCGKKSKKTSPCGANMECSEGDETYSCTCEKEFRQFGKHCVSVDKCAPGISDCKQECKNGICSCSPPFKLNEDGYTCDLETSLPECSLQCVSGKCLKDGTTEKCVCPKISHVFENKTCVDKCSAGKITVTECPIGCIPDASFGYICNCTGKYELDEDGVHCKARHMCSEGGGNNICSSIGGICVENFEILEGYECKCPFGYNKDKKTGKCKHKCENADCDKMQALCIIDKEGEVKCVCPPLLIKDSSGKCNQLAKYSYLGDFSVPKNKYKVVISEESDRSKRENFKEINHGKLLKDFVDSMENTFGDSKGASIVNCTDEDGDWKCFLEIKLEKDPGEKINIVSTPSVCLPLVDSIHCLIQPNFVTRKRTIDDAEVFRKTPRCDKDVIETMCGDETNCESSETDLKCVCKSGYSRRTYYEPAPSVTVEVCEDIDECLNATICSSNTTCNNLPGDYICVCKDGYRVETGKSAKNDGCKAVCESNPCIHGTCSATGKDGFTCSCEGLYTGRFCNLTNDAITGIKKKGYQTAGIIGGVLGAFLVLVIIICIFIFRKLKKQKSIDDTEEYVQQRRRGLASEMKKLGGRQPENKDFELRDNGRKPNRGQFENPKYSAQYTINPIDSMSTSGTRMERPADKGVNGLEVPERRESGDYRKGYTGDDKMFPKPHSSRLSDLETRRSSPKDDNLLENSKKPRIPSSDNFDYENTSVSRM